MDAPIPQPRLDDDEDVHWALSTAVALWGRGEHSEALKWLRRAAEQASDVNADKRALELFKAAADVANHVKAKASVAPPAPEPAPAPRPPAPPPAPPPRQPAMSRPGSVYPPPPAAYPAPPPPPSSVPVYDVSVSTPRPPMPSVPQVPSRPPSVPAPPLAGRTAPPPIPRTPPPPAGMSPPPAAPSPPRQAPTRPAVPVTPPVSPVAITAAKPAAPMAAAPKRRRSFTGEARPAHKSASADPRGRNAAPPAQPSHKRRRTHTDDDRVLAPPPATPSPAAAPPPRESTSRPAGTSIWDDVDEDTRVISNKRRAGDEIDQALERLRNAPAPLQAGPAQPSAQNAGRVPPAPLTEPGSPPAFAIAPAVVYPPVAVAGARSGIHEELTTDGTLGETESGTTSPGSHADQPPATQRPGSAVHLEVPAPAASTARAAKRLDTLPALRVAVLGTAIAGEVRLISLDAGDEPPPGAAVAMLVPLSGADGEAVARLFGGLE